MASPNDSPEVAVLKKKISECWPEQKRLRKELEQAILDEGNLRSQLRLLQEGLCVGDTILLGPKKTYGSVEVSADYPHLWLREIGANGNPTKRRFKIDTHYERTPARLAK